MTADRERTRRAAIETAAYEVLAERGFTGASMLTIAKRARASNETLYKWYGDKLGLFRAMVETNAEAAQARLAEALGGGGPLDEVLTGFGTEFLVFSLSERTIALNRVAAADGSGATGRALAAAGREAVVPQLGALIGAHLPGAPEALAEAFLDLLTGDLQVRRITGVLPAPDRESCARRARHAVEGLRALGGAR